jgi:hypothetical protein
VENAEPVAPHRAERIFPFLSPRPRSLSNVLRHPSYYAFLHHLVCCKSSQHLSHSSLHLRRGCRCEVKTWSAAVFLNLLPQARPPPCARPLRPFQLPAIRGSLCRYGPCSS